MTEFKIDEYYPKGEVYPMVVNFQNGYVTKEFEEKPCCLLQNQKTGEKTIATEVDGIVYAGKEDKEPGKTFILARNRKTGRARLIEVGTVSLHPELKTDLNTSNVLETSNLELSKKFGSKKQKKQLEQREKFKVNVETVTQQMKNITTTITEDKLDLSSYNKNDSDEFYIPPINRTADRVEDVYDIDSILTEEEYEKIYSDIQEHDITTDLLPIVKNIVTAKQKISEKHAVLAVYADALLKLYLTLMKDMSKKSFVACPLSATLNEIVLNNFCCESNGKRSRPAPYKDKSLCHAMVMLLLVNNFQFDFDSLCQCIKLTANTTVTKVKVTGARVVGTGSKKVVQLKLPLNTKSFVRRKSAKF